MIKVNKGNEPASWTAHRLTPGAKYEATPDLREALLKDQGYICAYCMRRIPVSDKGTDETTRIEHVVPQSRLTMAEAMDYRNMVICCPGAIQSTAEKDAHCDRRKAEHSISFSPFDQKFIETLSYGNDGSIKSGNQQFDSELNAVLNLNLPLLKANRKALKEELIKILNTCKWSKGQLERKLMLYSTKDTSGRCKEYCGIVQFYLRKKIRQLH